MDVEAECADQGAECGGGGVGLAALDAADLGLVDAGALGELLLCQVWSAALAGKLAGEGEVEAAIKSSNVGRVMCKGLAAHVAHAGAGPNTRPCSASSPGMLARSISSP